MRFLDIEVVTPPIELPVTVQQYIDHARLNGLTVDRQPDLIERKLKAATQRCEKYQRRALLTQTLKAFYAPQSRYGDSDCRLLRLPRGIVQSVTSVSSQDGVVDPAGYTLIWNVLTLDSSLMGAAEVVYVAGYDSIDKIPTTTIEGILEYATILFEDRMGSRETKYQASADKTIPLGVVDLWRPDQIELSG